MNYWFDVSRTTRVSICITIENILEVTIIIEDKQKGNQIKFPYENLDSFLIFELDEEDGFLIESTPSDIYWQKKEDINGQIYYQFTQGNTKINIHAYTLGKIFNLFPLFRKIGGNLSLEIYSVGEVMQQYFKNMINSTGLHILKKISFTDEKYQKISEELFVLHEDYIFNQLQTTANKFHKLVCLQNQSRRE